MSSVLSDFDFVAERTQRLLTEMRRVIVGQDAVMEGVVSSLLGRGHALLEGAPGLGKTLLMETLARALGLGMSRIQFTPDLMPADILGTQVLVPGEGERSQIVFRPGPIFSSVVLADEINRATPKTQSALLEAMAEAQVSLGGQTQALPRPHLVLATQNPLEMEGTYPLPEAQLDRFLFKLVAEFPSAEELHRIVARSLGTEQLRAEAVLSVEELRRMQDFVRSMPLSEHVKDYAVRLVRATHPQFEFQAPLVRRYVASGASPRGVLALLQGARVRALLRGMPAPGLEDVRAVCGMALGHRLMLNFEAEADRVRPSQVLAELLNLLPELVPA